MGDIFIGDTAQPDTGDIVIDSTGTNELEFELPRLPKGTVLLVLVVRDGAVTAPAGWTQVINGVGAASLFLDGWARMLDDSDMRGEDEALAIAAFSSATDQELQGHLYALANTSPAYVIEATAHAALAADATPAGPDVASQQAISRVVVVFSSSGAIDFAPPAGFAVDKEQTTNVFAERTIFVASKIGNASGTIAPGDGTAAPAATGRAWSVVVRNRPPLIPGELADVVPGHIGLIGPR